MIKTTQNFSDLIHSKVLSIIKPKGTPAYKLSLTRYIKLGMTEVEAKILLRG